LRESTDRFLRAFAADRLDVAGEPAGVGVGLVAGV
jgi:hypothetical protein